MLNCKVFCFLSALTVIMAVDLRKCHLCIYNQNEVKFNYECVSQPENYTGGTTEQVCTATQRCFTKRTVSKDTGEVYNLQRGCDEFDLFKNGGCTTDSAYEYCITECDDADFCNNKDHTTIGTPVNDTGVSQPKGKFVMCHLCVYSYHAATNDSCVTLPSIQPSIKCYEPRTCYTLGNWLTLENRWNSFGRGCENMSLRKKECADSYQFKDCLSTCCNDNCNTGTGRTAGVHPSCRAPLSPQPDPINAGVQKQVGMFAFVFGLIGAIWM